MIDSLFTRACITVAALLLSHVGSAQSIDLRTYFPERLNYYRWADGTTTHFYNISHFPISRDNWAGRLFLDYFNQPAGYVMALQKAYSGCTVTYAIFAMGAGTDQSVREVGDWYDTSVGQGACNGTFSVAGYRTFGTRSSVPTGLNWSTAGGLDTSWNQWNSMRVFNGISPYKYAYVDTYSSPGLIEVLPTWRPKYGRDPATGAWVANPNKTYYNVARIRFYHGTTQTPRACTGLDPSNPYSAFYYHGPNHSSMASEIYLDQQHGILQDTFLYAEHAQSGRPACDTSYPALASAENLQQALAQHEYYIDN